VPLVVASQSWLPDIVELTVKESTHSFEGSFRVLAHDIVASFGNLEQANLTAIFLFHHVQDVFSSCIRTKEALVSESISDWECAFWSAESI